MADRTQDSPAAGAIISAMSHELRPQIVALAAVQPISARDVATALTIPLPNASYHVRQLAHAGLLRYSHKKESRATVQRFYVLDSAAREHAIRVLEETVAKLRGPA